MRSKEKVSGTVQDEEAGSLTKRHLSRETKTNGRAKSSASTVTAAVILMAVSTLQAIAASLSKKDGVYPYKVIGATLMSEVFKLTASLSLLVMELSNTRPESTRVALHASRRSVVMAAVPGVSYQILNNLNFVTLYYVDAPTFQILGNLKIVATGIAGQCLLGRTMSRGKWLALALLTLGAATSQIGSHGVPKKCANTADSSSAAQDVAFAGKVAGYASALVCVFLSATMGVFTEMYMKGNPASIHFQNAQLYFFGILANLVALFARSEIGPGASTPLLHGFNFWAVVTVVTNGSCGLAVSFLLRYADSIAKTYSSCMAIPCTSIAAFLFLDVPIGAPNLLGSGVMVISLAYFYFGDALFPADRPTDNTPKDTTSSSQKPSSPRKPSIEKGGGPSSGVVSSSSSSSGGGVASSA